MGTTAEKINYSIEATEMIEEGINALGGNITPQTPLKNFKTELDTIYNKLPKLSGEGSNITLRPTLKGRMQITPIGNASQESTQGYNLLPISEPHTVTINGITMTIHEDKSISFKGTSTSACTFYLFGDSNYQTARFKLNAGDYTLNLKEVNSMNFMFNIRKTDNSLAFSQMRGIYNSNQTLAEETHIGNISVYIMANTTIDTTIYPLLVKGTYTSGTIPEYEPYTNGTSPNPDYLQDIKVVTGKNKIRVRGKNLTVIERNAHPAVDPYIVGGLSYSYGKNTVTVVGTRTMSTGESYILKKRFKAGTYTLSGLPNKEISDADRATVYFWYDTTPNSNLSNSDDTITNVYKKYAFTSDKDFYLGFRIISQGNAIGDSLEYNQTYNIQIEEGLTATSFEPYVEPQKLSLDLSSKNKFDINIFDQNRQETSVATVDYIQLQLKPNATYTISENSELQGNNANVFITLNNEAPSTAANGVIDKKTITTNNSGIVYVMLRNESYRENSIYSKFLNGTYYIQIEEGIEATTCAPYYNYEFAKIGEYADIIFKNEKTNPLYNSKLLENTWYKRASVKKLELDGDINEFTYKHTVITSDKNGFYQFSIADKIKTKPSGSTDCALCNYLKYINSTAQDAINYVGIWWERKYESRLCLYTLFYFRRSKCMVKRIKR